MPAKKDTETKAVKKKTTKKTAVKKKATKAATAEKTAAKKTVKKKVVKKAVEKVAAAPKPKVAKKTAPKASNARLRVRQVRSGIGNSFGMKRTLVALGLKHHQDEVELPDNPAVRGMLNKVHHLVRVDTAEKK
jgi:ribosomal protein L30